jgi:ankyrin repeat protein
LAFHYFDPNDGGNITVLAYLFSQNGIDGNIKDNDGCTLLHMGCQYINILPLEIFQHLIEKHGCDINVHDDYNDNALHYAIDFFDANAGGDITVLPYLLSQKGINGNIKDKYGYNLLHWACRRINYLQLDVFKVLIETIGCDVNAQNNNKNTPIHRALRAFDPNEGGNITVLMYLLGNENFNVNIKGRNGDSLLHYACKKARKLSVDVFKLLIETHGCDVNVRDEYDNTPLHYAFHRFDPNNNNNITVFAYLINQKNFNVNIKGRNGRTFLHLACTWDISELNHVSDSEDDFSDLDDDWNVLEAKLDTVLSQIVEIIAERCGQQISDEFS